MAKIVGIDLGTTNRNLFMRRFLFGSKLNSHNIGNNNQGTGNQEQSSPCLSAIYNGIKLFSSHCENRSNAIARIILNIAKPSELVNVVWSSLTNPGPINTRPNQPADRLPLIPEKTRKNDFLTPITLTKIGVYYN